MGYQLLAIFLVLVSAVRVKKADTYIHIFEENMSMVVALGYSWYD